MTHGCGAEVGRGAMRQTNCTGNSEVGAHGMCLRNTSRWGYSGGREGKSGAG